MLDLEQLLTETRNPDTLDIDVLPTDGILLEINREDLKVAEAVRQALAQISSAVDRIVDALRAGGRLIYLGAGNTGCFRVLAYVRYTTGHGPGSHCGWNWSRIQGGGGI